MIMNSLCLIRKKAKQLLLVRYLPLGVALIIILLSGKALSADEPLPLNPASTLFQRVLTLPDCRLVSEPGSAAGEVLSAFSRFYVYKRETISAGDWLQVGPDSFGSKAGWLSAKCTVPWKMQLTLAFTNPAGRDRVLFFNNKPAIETLFSQEDPSPAVNEIRKALKEENKHRDIVSQEPEYAIDFNEKFYLLPVLEAEETMTEQGLWTRMLKVASVTTPDLSGQAVKPANTANTVVEVENDDPASNLFKGFKASIVFVIDSTVSMGPYIDRTKEAIRKIYAEIESEQLLDKVKFGLVAYRSSTEAVPEIDYVSRIFVDPVTVKNGEDFLAQVKTLKAATASTPSFNEDTYSGVMQSLDEIKWNEFGARYIVLITDAGALDGDDKHSGTLLDAQQVRQEAEYRGVAVYALHLKTKAGRINNNHSVAEEQYSVLTHNSHLNKPLYYPIEAGDVEQFGRKIDSLAEAIASQVKVNYSGDSDVGSASFANPNYGKSDPSRSPEPKQEQSPEPPKVDELLSDAALLGHAMKMAYLGKKTGAKAPSVFEAWISDRDIVQQEVPTVKVRVLLTKSQLSDLSDVVKQILDAANSGLISPGDMFEQLRSISATMGNDPNRVNQKDASKLSSMGLIGEYIENLPYMSEVMELDQESWKAKSFNEQEQLIRSLNTKLRYYRRYNEDADRWISLAEGSDPRDHVYPVPLDTLP